MDAFLLRAILGGLGVVLLAGPLGCFVVWRRMAYFGAALAHSALLGVALGFLLGMDLTLGILTTCVAVGLVLWQLERQHRLPTDTLLGVLAHVSLALGLVALAFMEHLRVDLMGYLFGDILAVGPRDLRLIYATAGVGLALLAWIWRDLLSITVSEEMAAAEGVRVEAVRLTFILLLAAAVAIGMKIVGMLLVLSLIIVPAAAARGITRTPEQMALAAVAIGALSVLIGVVGSLEWDAPTGPLIVCAAAGLFALCHGAAALGRIARRIRLVA